MKLNHINLTTTDVSGLADFFRRFFGFELLAMRGQNAFAILRGSDGFALNLMQPGKTDSAEYPPNFHIGFVENSPRDVLAKHAELNAAGIEADGVQTLTRGGSTTTVFYCRAPDGLLVEVSAETG